MRVAAKTDAGRIRLANEDCYYVGELPGGVAWAVICDGMGGAAGGDIASQTAANCVSDIIVNSYQEQMGSRSIRRLLITALDNANLRVHDISLANESLSGMGTTVVAAIVADRKVFIAHAGDSRAYIFDGKKLTQLTKDHSLVQEMVDIGQITEDEARVHPRKNLITRVLGVYETLDVDYCEEEIPPGSMLLICTDGLTDALDLDEIAAILREHYFADCAEVLVRRANENGGPDNITVVLVES